MERRVSARRGRNVQKAPIRPIRRNLQRMAYFDEKQCDAIHKASLQVLETTGVVFGLEAARDVLRNAGASVEGDVVRFPRELIERALAATPRQFTLCGRAPDGAEDLLIDGSSSYMNLDGNGMDVIDFSTGERRGSTLRDLEDATRIADWLPQISYVWPVATARDCPEATQALWETFIQMKNTSKHIMTMTVASGTTARGVLEMAAVLCGGMESLREKPIISTFLCATSPLAFETGACEAIVEFAKAGLPTGIMTMPISGATAPISVAGNLVQVNTEFLAGLALIQTINPGCPTFYASCTTLMDLRTGGVTSNGPEDYLLQAGVAAMSRSKYDIPVMTGIMGTEARFPGWQAGVEDSLSCYTSVLCGADMMPGAGLLKNATTLSFEELLMGCEIYEIIKRTAEGAPVDEASLAVEVIERVGPRRDFMTDEHTLTNMRGVWQPEILRRCSYDAWEKDARRDALETARERAAWILEHHRPQYVAEEKERELRAIIAKYQG